MPVYFINTHGTTRGAPLSDFIYVIFFIYLFLGPASICRASFVEDNAVLSYFEVSKAGRVCSHHQHIPQLYKEAANIGSPDEVLLYFRLYRVFHEARPLFQHT